MTYTGKLVVAVKSKGKFIKEDRTTPDPTVWIPFGAEYSLFFKNLSTKRAVVNVSIDGKDVLDGNALIVEPNKPFELERFISNVRKGNRFKFIEKTDQISEHRGEHPEDGLIQVTFQYEKPWRPVTLKPYILEDRWTPPHHTFYNSVGSRGPLGSNGPDGVYGSVGATTSINCCLSDSVVYGSSSNCFADAVATAAVAGPANDQGITVKGSVSDQQFTHGWVGELEPQVFTIVLQMKGGEKPKPQPVIQKCVITTSQCSTCGTTFMGRPKFCANCGTAISAEIR